MRERELNGKGRDRKVRQERSEGPVKSEKNKGTPHSADARSHGPPPQLSDWID